MLWLYFLLDTKENLFYNCYNQCYIPEYIQILTGTIRYVFCGRRK